MNPAANKLLVSAGTSNPPYRGDNSIAVNTRDSETTSICRTARNAFAIAVDPQRET